MGEEHATTKELRARQFEREAVERSLAEHAESEEDAKRHARRAERNAYLRERLEKRAEAEEDAFVREREREEVVGRRRRERARHIFGARA